MPTPLNAVTVPQPLDPADVLDIYVALSQGAADASPPPILLTGETVASMTLAVTSEAAALGLGIRSTGAYPAPTIDQTNTLAFWIGVDAAHQADAAFAGTGITLGVELTITTNNSPPRVKQRTIAVTVAQQ